MKMRLLCLPLLLFALAACADRQRLPELAGMEAGPEKEACASVHPAGNWQFVHSIAFAMADGSGSTVLGVTSLDGDELHCVLLTVEGLTLFEAVFRPDGSTEVQRAVPPFTGPEFAAGLFRDIHMIFQPPTGGLTGVGRLADGSLVCRYAGTAGGVVDILPDKDGCWQIRDYNREQLLDRSIAGTRCMREAEPRIPQSLVLQASGPAGYTLKMTLIRADRLQ